MRSWRWLSFAVGVFVLLAAVDAAGAPRWVRLSWTQPADTSMTITWTDEVPGDGTVEVWDPEQNARVYPATSFATGDAELGATYSALADGLKPDTAYRYRVSSGGQTSEWRTFRTAPPVFECRPFRFMAGGDSRGEDILTYIPSMQWDQIVLFAAAVQPLFFVHTGDFVRDGAEADQWAKEMPRLEPLSSISPYFMIMGNHDDMSPEGPTAYFNQLFETPANGPDAVDDYFSMVIGNVLIVGLSNYTFDYDTQIDFLRAELERTKNLVDWRVVFFHVPIWSSGAHGSNEDNQNHAERLVPLLDEYGVELVLNGHDHDYERFHPSRGGWGGAPREINPLPYDDGRRGTPQGTVYYVTGGGGALENIIFVPHEEGFATGSPHLNYLVIDVDRGQMTITSVDCGVLGVIGADCSTNLETVILTKEHSVCDTTPDGGSQDGGADGGADGGEDAGTDPGPDETADAEEDSGPDAGADPGPGDAQDAGADPGSDPGSDAGIDAGDGSTPGDQNGGASSGCGCGAGTAGSLGALLVLALGGRWTRRREIRRD
jgi:predicted phosphodiesterase